MTKATATLREISTTGELWNRYRHLAEIEGRRVAISAIHGVDDSTRARYEAAAPGSIMVTLLDLTAKTHHRAMLAPETVFELVADKGQSYL